MATMEEEVESSTRTVWIGSLLSQPQRPQREEAAGWPLVRAASLTKELSDLIEGDQKQGGSRRLSLALSSQELALLKKLSSKNLLLAAVEHVQAEQQEEGGARASTCLRTGTTCIGFKRAAPLAPAASHACANKASGTRLADGLHATWPPELCSEGARPAAQGLWRRQGVSRVQPAKRAVARAFLRCAAASHPRDSGRPTRPAPAGANI